MFPIVSPAKINCHLQLLYDTYMIKTDVCYQVIILIVLISSASTKDYYWIMSLNGGALNDADMMLIESVRQTNILYNPTTVDFRLSHKKDKAWQELALRLGINPTDGRRRWTCLRDRYTRELRQLRLHSSKTEDYGTESMGSELFRHMDFLRPFVKKRVIHRNPWKAKDSHGNAKIKLHADDTMQSFSENTVDDYDNKMESTVTGEEYNLEACELDPLESYEEYTADHQNFTETQHIKSVKNDVIPIVLSPMPANASVVNNTTVQHHHLINNESKGNEIQTQHENEDDFFCKSVAMYLRKLSRRHKIKAKVEMFQILEKYIEIEENSSTALEQQRILQNDRH